MCPGLVLNAAAVARAGGAKLRANYLLADAKIKIAVAAKMIVGS